MMKLTCTDYFNIWKLIIILYSNHQKETNLENKPIDISTDIEQDLSVELIENPQISQLSIKTHKTQPVELKEMNLNNSDTGDISQSEISHSQGTDKSIRYLSF